MADEKNVVNKITEGKKPKMSDEERRALMIKMDADLDSFIKERQAAYRGPEGPLPSDMTVDELASELKQHPAFMTEFDPTQELSPAMEGLQKLKYESESCDVNADSFKEDGNYNFKKKKYRWAIESYSKGIQEKSKDRSLNAFLYSNRAAARYRIGNYRSAILDCVMARKFKPDHIKCINKGVQCLLELKQYDDAIKWCDDGLFFEPENKEFLDMRAKAVKLKKEQDRDSRKKAAKERKEQQEQEKLVKAIKDRGVQLADVKSRAVDSLILSNLESCHPSGAKVHVMADGSLCWPVLFVYPEYGQTDLIEAFSENTRFTDHIVAMFGQGVEPAPWDEKAKYKADNLLLYFENKENEKLHTVEQTKALRDVLEHDKFIVYGGTPSFIILVKDSPFSQHFLEKYTL